MKEKKNGIEITITCDSKEELNKMAEAIRNAIINGELNTMKDDSNEPEPKREVPVEKTIYSASNEEGDVYAIFRANGKESTDEDGDAWWEADWALELNENLLQPFVVVKGESQSFLAEDCRVSNDEEVELFRSKVKEFKVNEKDAVWVPKGGETYWYPLHDSFSGNSFSPQGRTWENDENDIFLAEKGWVFHSYDKCKKACAKLNEAIKNVK